jgi:adenylate cyclase
LLEGGVPIARFSVGRTVLHPVFGLIDMIWDIDKQRVETETISRSRITEDFMRGSPFSDMSKRNKTDPLQAIFADLTKPEEVARYELFEKLATDGMTHYVAFGKSFGIAQTLFTRMANDFRGASMSFTTRRFSGFSKTDVNGLQRLIPAICACIRIDNDRLLAKEVLEAYLGRIAGRQVLTGQIERGDGERIECVILYSDLRGSLTLSQELDLQTYLETVNQYFDCVATAMIEHGGDVLKFIGDGVLAIFPVDDVTRPRTNMCAAALSAAREAFARADHTNAKRSAADLPAIAFGIGLHAGEVIYGNVGTQKRLDFTATGPAVGLAARIEGLTKDLEAPLLASADFAMHCAEKGETLAAQTMRSFSGPVEITRYPVNP